jgi:hypothetical protein
LAKSWASIRTHQSILAKKLMIATTAFRARVSVNTAI